MIRKQTLSIIMEAQLVTAVKILSNLLKRLKKIQKFIKKGRLRPLVVQQQQSIISFHTKEAYTVKQ